MNLRPLHVQESATATPMTTWMTTFERPEQVEEQQPEELEVRDVQLALDDLGVVVQADEFGATFPLRFLSWKSVNDIQVWKSRGRT